MNRKNRDGRTGHAQWLVAEDTVTYVDLRPRTDQLTMAANRDPAPARQKPANATITWPAV
ncbi:hypothetical protein E0H73_38805 [Kribbella pittospori]|uniref:Uncharacterized protein n=1 Tax=Kribbella pittospori TaxID=722689 RepID=A0A4V2M986_9ACTN|nr:hypothetical protein [Kribbella pittospori]TCC54402.1 hypothetical protein E0H73_38805 [Kribbella pittospori]